MKSFKQFLEDENKNFPMVGNTTSESESKHTIWKCSICHNNNASQAAKCQTCGKEKMNEEVYSYEDHAKIAKMHDILKKNKYEHLNLSYIHENTYKTKPKTSRNGKHSEWHEVRIAPKGHFAHEFHQSDFGEKLSHTVSKTKFGRGPEELKAHLDIWKGK